MLITSWTLCMQFSCFAVWVSHPMCMLSKHFFTELHKALEPFLDEGSAWSYCLSTCVSSSTKVVVLLAERRWWPWTYRALPIFLLHVPSVALVGTELVQHGPSSASPDSYYQKSEKKCADKFCSDSSSDCGSSSGSVRASRGSWGSWSSSSSDCDRKLVVDAQHLLPPGEYRALILPAASTQSRGAVHKQSKWAAALRLGLPQPSASLFSSLLLVTIVNWYYFISILDTLQRPVYLYTIFVVLKYFTELTIF